jgi:hypothetical protein
LPTSVNVPPGSTSTTFSVTPADYDANYTANVKATDGFFSVAGAFTVDTITLTSISASPNPISAGAGSTGTVYISQPAPAAGWTVNLSSSTSYVGVPSSVVIPPGQQSKTFPITTADYYVNYAASIKATDSVSSKSTTLNVTCTYLTSVSASPNPVGAGDACTGTVNISQPAPTGGWTVNLSSSTSYAGVPSSVVVPAGSTSATFPIVTTNYYENFNATIKATDSVSTVSTALTVDSLYISSLSLSPTSVANGTPSQGTVTLNGVAPAGGWTIQLVSSEPGYASVPASILIPAGSSSATFTVTTGLATVKFIQNVSITASYLVSSKSASLELTP